MKIIPVKNLDAVSDERIAAIKKLTKKGQDALRRAESLEQKVIRMKQAGAPEEPGPLTADIVYEKLGRKPVPRLHVRKRRAASSKATPHQPYSPWPAPAHTGLGNCREAPDLRRP